MCRIDALADYLLELAVKDYSLVTAMRNELAAAAVALANLFFGRQSWVCVQCFCMKLKNNSF